MLLIPKIVYSCDGCLVDSIAWLVGRHSIFMFGVIAVNMELAQYIRLFRKWLWLLVLAAFLGSSISFIRTNRQDPVYRAEVTLFVGGFISDPNPGSSDIFTGKELAQTYAVLATSYDILEATVNTGGFPTTPGALRGAVTTSIIPETSLLKITVTYGDPVLAADIADQLAEQLILNSPDSLTPEQLYQVGLLRDQITSVSDQLASDQEEINQIAEQLEVANEEGAVQLGERRDILIDRITTSSTALAQLTNTLQYLQRQTNQLEVWESARIPGGPVGGGTLRSTLIGGVAGAVLALGGVLLLEYLNDTIRTPEEATTVLGLPILGTILRFGRTNDSYPRRLITHLHPSSPIAEGYRALRTNLLFSSNGQEGQKRAFVVTSPGPEEGKTVTTANLAVAMATAGLRVLLVDADLRRPKVHHIFDLDNELGLTTLLFADPARSDGRAGQDTSSLPDKLHQCVQNTAIPRLRVITSGFSPSNPTEILGSALMKRWFQEFVSSSDIDVVLFDTPPALVVADASVLAATIEMPVMMVVRAGRTRRTAAVRVKHQLETLGVDMAGVTLNSLSLSDQGYGYGSSYYYYYYYSNDKSARPTGWRRFLPRRRQL